MAASFVFDRDRHAYLAAHLELRRLLAERTGIAPEALRFIRVPGHKPVLHGDDNPTGVHFSISHTRGFVAIALSEHGPVGVDVEAVRPVEDLTALCEMVFHPREHEAMRVLGDDAAAQLGYFFRVWTAKEAYCKAIGLGLAHPLPQIGLDESDPSESGQALMVDEVLFSKTPVFRKYIDGYQNCQKYQGYQIALVFCDSR